VILGLAFSAGRERRHGRDRETVRRVVRAADELGYAADPVEASGRLGKKIPTRAGNGEGRAGPGIAGLTKTPGSKTMHVYARRRRLGVLLVAVATAIACGGDSSVTDPGVTTPPPAPAKVLLRDVLVDGLPSPFYHFDYDVAGTITAVSYASGLTSYDVIYAGGRIKELQNNVFVNRDRLVYSYDDAGRVAGIRYVDANGVTFTVVVFTYDGDRLTEVERSKGVPGGLIIDKVVSLAYYPDGNLRERREHRPKIDGLQDESTTVDLYEGYDSGINVDGFSLIHDDFFDHLVLLPGVVLQKTNPRRETRTGDGLNFTVEYTYQYDGANRPLSKQGALTITNGIDQGTQVQVRSLFSYY
jgi:hypothetical protein